MSGLPTGTVTFLFTDLEGSTRLWEEHAEAMRAAVARHDELVRNAFERHHGHVFKTGGDAFCVAFQSAPDALAAALAAQLALAGESWGETGPLRVRMALHSGSADERGGDYYGQAPNRVARLLAVGHGGQTLLSQAAAGLVRDALPRDVALSDLGAHRLKDLQQPEPVFQLVHPGLPDGFPPLRSLESVPHNLPLQLTSFVGRERELKELAQLLETTRLLTLTGAGGSGKTRLALQLGAERLEDYPEGIWFIDLAALTDAALVTQTVAAALGVREQPGRALVEVLAEALRQRALLLVLDNCEHLIEACAGLAERLLRACPGVRVLATSREALNVAGEMAWPVPALSSPDPRDLPRREIVPSLAQYEAVRLFIDRASMVKPHFVLTDQNAPAVAQICHQLDGIPLAIELAASRVKVMAVDHIASRLDDRFRLLTGGSRTALPRHQTLRAAIDWSYGLLSEPERRLLRRLSVFAGGWSLEAVEAVCAGEGLEAWEVLDLQALLIEKSLVLLEKAGGGEERYRLLGTIRHYAADRLVEAGEAGPTRGRHLDWFLALAERASPELRSDKQAEWLECLEQEHENLRAALEWSMAAAGDGEPAVRLAGALWRFWYVRGYLAEGSRWLEAALAKGDGAAAAPRARALRGAGNLLDEMGDAKRARAPLEQALALYRELGDKYGLARTLLVLGSMDNRESLHDRARARYEEALEAAREIGDAGIVGGVLNSLGELARLRGDHAAARTFYLESLEAHGESETQGRAVPLFNLGQLELAADNSRAARGLYQASLRTAVKLGARSHIAYALEGLAGAAMLKGQPERAGRLLGAAEALRKVINAHMDATDLPLYERTVAAARAALGEEAWAAARAAGAALPLEQAVRLGLEEASPNAQPMTAAGRDGLPTPAAEKEGADA
jgi:predicted ATPase/class 3 adenylate cyclase